MKYKHKITPEIHSKIILIANELPTMQKYMAGKPLFRKLTKRIPGTEVPEEHRLKIKNFDVNKPYTQVIEEPLLVNHKVCLLAEYELHGMAGINFYIDAIDKIATQKK